MSAPLSAAPGQAISAAQNILHPASTAASGLATAADTPAGDHAPSFAALFRQLAARQPSGDEAPITLQLPADATITSEAETTDALSALLPFLEGMGMIPADGEAANAVTQEDLATQDSIPEDTALALAVPASAPAITAAELPDDAAMTDQDGMLHGSRPALAAIDNAQSLQGDLITEQAGKSVQAAAQATNVESGRGREFASQLVAAIDTSKEGAHTPGSTSAAVHQVMAATPSHVAPTTPLQVTQPVGTPGWGEEVGHRIVWMANRMESRAELVLTPPQMGRVEVSLTISGDQASANFASTNPAVRDALEAALPRLREVLADAGIQLGQAQVGAENPGQTAREGKSGDNPGFDRAGERDAGSLRMTESGVPSPAGLKSGRGLVDVFA